MRSWLDRLLDVVRHPVWAAQGRVQDPHDRDVEEVEADRDRRDQEKDARIAELEREVERYKLLLIEAKNPGIDMEEVRRTRRAGPP